MRSVADVKKMPKEKLNAYWNIPVVVTIAVFLIEAIVKVVFLEMLHYIM